MSGRLWRCVPALLLVAAVVTVGVVVGVARPAGAHAFLVGTEPAQGERLAGPPSAVVLVFSEAPDLSLLRVGLEMADGDRVEVAGPEVTGSEARVGLGELGDGIYVVTWEATSAVDGHGSAGEFAFAVGDVAGAIPAARSGSSTSGWGWLASVLFFAGLALAAGSLILRRLAAGSDASPGVGVVRAGLLVATAGATAGVLAPAGSDWKLLVTIELLAAALLIVGLWGDAWVAPLVCVVAAAGVWAGRSHGAADHGAVGWLVDFVHLAAGAAWAGSLVLVAVTGWRLRRRGRPWLGLVARYARLALALVVVLGTAGVVSAAELVPTWADLWGTGYGRLVVSKAGLLLVALVAAAVARGWGLPRRRARGVRSMMTAEAGVVAVAVVVAGLLANGTPPLPAAAAEELLGPPPLRGDVARDAGLAGQLNVEVAADGRRLEVDVFGPSGPLAGTNVEVTVEGPGDQGVDLAPRPCGPGCFTQARQLDDGVTQVRVAASAPDWTGGYFEARLRWPPGRLAPERLAGVVARMREIPELTMVETTTSGPGAEGSPGAFTLSGAELMASEPYAGANVDDVRLAGEDRLVLYLPGEQIFTTLDLDQGGRLARARMVTPGHEIRREFNYPPGSP